MVSLRKIAWKLMRAVATARGHGHVCKPLHHSPPVEKTWRGKTNGEKEKNHGPSSRPQRTIREHRSFAGRLSGHRGYPNAKRMLILCDGGGSNSARQHLFKEDLQRLANLLGVEIRVAHYPPYCSKYNPIEHRVFPHVTRACQGIIFHSLEVAKQFIERTQTSRGLRVTVRILEKCYATGRKYLPTSNKP